MQQNETIFFASVSVLQHVAYKGVTVNLVFQARRVSSSECAGMGGTVMSAVPVNTVEMQKDRNQLYVGTTT